MFKLARDVGRRVMMQRSVMTRSFFTAGKRHYRSQAGVALIMVMLVVALASILVINLAYSTYIGARINISVERSLQAEYLLKSALNLARVLIMADTSLEDSQNDPWAFFKNGAVIPPALMGLTEPNLEVELEVRSENSKIPLTSLRMNSFPGGTDQQKWRDALARIMENELKFDEDEEEDQSGHFPGRVFTSKELVANLIDYQSESKEPYESGEYKGCKGDLPAGTFPERKIMRVGELASIPGFTPIRVQKLMPYVTTGFATVKNKVNINSVLLPILRALDENITPQQLEEIDNYRKSTEHEPFKSGPEVENILSANIWQSISNLVMFESREFQVVAKVDYGTSTYFLRAYLDRDLVGQGMPPQVKSIELF